jgi:phosphatidylinositol glycan class W
MFQIVTSVYFALIPVRLSWISSLVIGISYEFTLDLGLGSWILSPDTAREDLLSSNREGILSTAGYVAIYLAGVAWGQFFIANIDGTFKSYLSAMKKLAIWALLMWASLWYSHHKLEMVSSRRMANWGYFLWMVIWKPLDF